MEWHVTVLAWLVSGVNYRQLKQAVSCVGTYEVDVKKASDGEILRAMAVKGFLEQARNRGPAPEDPERTCCAQCRCKIPPGKTGRRCQGCRDGQGGPVQRAVEDVVKDLTRES
jgi:hypothetical protein